MFHTVFSPLWILAKFKLSSYSNRLIQLKYFEKEITGAFISESFWSYYVSVAAWRRIILNFFLLKNLSNRGYQASCYIDCFETLLIIEKWKFQTISSRWKFFCHFVVLGMTLYLICDMNLLWNFDLI